MTEESEPTATRRTVCKALGATVALGTIPASAAAQDATETATASPTSTPTATPTPEGEQLVVNIDQTTRITDWRFDGGTFYITLDADTPQILKITDSGAVMKAWSNGADGGGATTIPTQGFTITSGKTTVEFDAVTFEEAAAVTVATANGAAFVFTEGIEAGKPALSWGTVQGLLATAVGGTGGLTYRYVKRKRDDEEHEHERLI